MIDFWWYRILIVVFALSIALGYAYTKGQESTQKKWDLEAAKIVVAQNRALVDRIAENDAAEAKQKTKIKGIRNVYEAELKAVRGFASAGRLRISSALCNTSSVPGDDIPSTGSNGGDTGTIILSEETSRDFKEFALKADEAIVTCRAAQSFIKSYPATP